MINSIPVSEPPSFTFVFFFCLNPLLSNRTNRFNKMKPSTQEKKKYVIPRPRNVYNFGVALFVAVGSLCYGCSSPLTIQSPYY